MPTITRLSLADATAAQLETRIAAGEWAIGARLPTETEFMVELGIGRSTVRAPRVLLSQVNSIWPGMSEVASGFKAPVRLPRHTNTLE